MSWWSKFLLVLMPVFLVLGCLSVVKGEFHEAVTDFAVLGLYVALYALERIEIGSVRRSSARRSAYRVYLILVAAFSVAVGLVTGMVVLAVLSLFTLMLVEHLVQKRFEESTAG